MRSHVDQAATKFLKLSGKTIVRLPKVLTHVWMTMIPIEEIHWKGRLNVVPVRIFSKATFIACLSSFLHVVNCTALMHEATRRIAAMNWRLHCLTSWTHHASEWYQGCNVGDLASDITLMIVFRRLSWRRPEVLKFNFRWHSFTSGPKMPLFI